jgi:hypothetical protein
VHLSHKYRGVNNVASLVITVARAQKIQLYLLSKSIYFSSNLVGVVLRYLGWSVRGSHQVANSIGDYVKAVKLSDTRPYKPRAGV